MEQKSHSASQRKTTTAIEAIMNGKELSLRKLGKMSGVTHRQVQRIKDGITQNPGVQTVAKLAYALDLDPAALFYAFVEDNCSKEMIQTFYENGHWRSLASVPVKIDLESAFEEAGKISEKRHDDMVLFNTFQRILPVLLRNIENATSELEISRATLTKQLNLVKEIVMDKSGMFSLYKAEAAILETRPDFSAVSEQKVNATKDDISD